MEEDKEYLIILDLLFRVVDCNRGVVQLNQKLFEAESLARKFFCHCASVFYLSRGTNIDDFPSTKVGFFDVASINVLARATIESFLAFHYIFGSKVTEEERNFRFYSWQLGGLKERQKSLPSIQIREQQAKKVRANEQKRIQNYEQILKNNKIFLKLNKKHQKRILEGNWRNKILGGKCENMSWREIALDAELSELHAEHVYRYLCGYAHSSSLSILQLSQANTAQVQSALFAGTVGVIKIAMSNFIFEYCKLFPNSKLELNKNAEAKMAAEDWIRIGKEA